MIYTYIDEKFNHYSLIDIGIIQYSIALLVTEKNLGTCYPAQSVIYPDVIREFVEFQANKEIVLGTAIGYPDERSQANRFVRKRGELADFVKWMDIV